MVFTNSFFYGKLWENQDGEILKIATQCPKDTIVNTQRP
jgi:hypothetical protein